MSPRRSVGRDAPGTATRRKVRRARAPHGRRHATASHRWRRDRIAVSTARARAAQHQRRTAGDAAIAGYGTGSRVEYLLVPRVFGLGGPLVAMVGTNMGAGQRDRAMRAAWIGAAMATGLTEMIGLGAAAVPYAWLSLFDTDPVMLGAGARPGAHAVAPGGRMLVYGALSSHRQTDPSAFEMPVFAPRLIYSAAAVQGWYLLHWLEVTPLADCGAIFAKVLDRLASGALRLPPAKRHRPQNIADALRDADGAQREGKPLLDLSSWAAD